MAKKKAAAEAAETTGTAVAVPNPPGTPSIPTDGAALEIAVDWGQVSIGDATARIGFKVDRSTLNINAADDLLAGRRLSVAIRAHAPGDDPSQTYLPGTPHAGAKAIHATADSKKFSANAKAISGGLTFSIDEIDVSALGNFAKRPGVLTVNGIERLDADPDGDDEPDESAESPAADTPANE